MLMQGASKGKVTCGNLVMKMRELKRYWKKRRGNKYPCEVILVASIAFWIIALMLYIQCR